VEPKLLLSLYRYRTIINLRNAGKRSFGAVYRKNLKAIAVWSVLTLPNYCWW